LNKLSYEKFARKMLIKLTPVVAFFVQQCCFVTVRYSPVQSNCFKYFKTRYFKPDYVDSLRSKCSVEIQLDSFDFENAPFQIVVWTERSLAFTQTHKTNLWFGNGKIENILRQ
jgi:hypothetical protein